MTAAHFRPFGKPVRAEVPCGKIAPDSEPSSELSEGDPIAALIASLDRPDERVQFEARH